MPLSTLATTAAPLTDRLSRTFPGETAALVKFSDVAGDLAVNLLIAAGIFAATLWLSGWLSGLVARGIRRLPRTHDDETLQDFAASVTRYGVIVIGVVAILRRLGVETTSIITVLGAASLAVGLALQGALSNVAAGVMILLFRPYRVGDFVLIAGKQGTVKRFDLFNTEIADPDGLKVVVPNGKAFGDVVVNYTDIPQRRIELDFGVGYETDLDHAAEVAVRAAAANAHVLAEPKPWSKPSDLKDSTITLKLRCWTHVDGYWDTRFDVLKAVKQAFDAEGISLPYPIQVSVPAPSVAAAPAATPSYSQGGPDGASA
jgi:small conductance mechanosensitive channel